MCSTSLQRPNEPDGHTPSNLPFNQDVINPHDGHILCDPDSATRGFSLRIQSSRISPRNKHWLYGAPTYGAAPGEKCELSTGQPRTDPHLDRPRSRIFSVAMLSENLGGVFFDRLSGGLNGDIDLHAGL